MEFSALATTTYQYWTTGYYRQESVTRIRFEIGGIFPYIVGNMFPGVEAGHARRVGRRDTNTSHGRRWRRRDGCRRRRRDSGRRRRRAVVQARADVIVVANDGAHLTQGRVS